MLRIPLDALVETLMIWATRAGENHCLQAVTTTELKFVNARINELDGGIPGGFAERDNGVRHRADPGGSGTLSEGLSRSRQRYRGTSAPESSPGFEDFQKKRSSPSYLSAVVVRPSRTKGGRSDPERAERCVNDLGHPLTLLRR